MTPIVTINYNGSKDTIALLKSLRSSCETYNLIIVDNNSPNKDEVLFIENYLFNSGWKQIENTIIDDGLIKFVKVYSFETCIVTIIQAKENNGFSKGTNIGLRYCLSNNDSKYVAILNNDTEVTPNFIKTIICEMEKNNISAAMGTILYFGYEKPYIWSIGGKVNWIRGECVHDKKNQVFNNDDYPKIVERGFVSGCFTVFNSDDLKEIGLLDEDYFFAGEEYQYSIDLLRHKKRLAWIPGSVIYHKSLLEEGNGSSHTISDLAWQYNAYMVKIVFINKNKNCVFRLFWRAIFRLHLNIHVRKHYYTSNKYSKEAFFLLKRELINHIKSRQFTLTDFLQFKDKVANLKDDQN